MSLEIPYIRATSPTLAEIMRGCELRAGLARAPGSSNFILGNPKGWLGTAYHEVLERIIEVDLGTQTLDAAVERLWNEAIARQYQRACGHSLDHRFGLPTSWAGYQLARASVALRARDLVARRESVSAGAATASRDHPGGALTDIREQEFTACGGKLIGRPDAIQDGEVVDYKSGAIVEHDEVAQTEVVKAGYLRQLRIYGYLVNETLGWWPRRGFLLPIVGAGIEVALEPGSCKQEALEAVALLDAYNAKVAAHAEAMAFASPSPQACRWCPLKLVCPPFWQSVSPAWSGQLDGAVLEGVVDEAPRAIHSGAAVALSIHAESGSEVSSQVQIAPLKPTMHPVVDTVATGDRVRLVGLRVRPDGTLVPTQRTVLARVCDLPRIGVARQVKSHD